MQTIISLNEGSWSFDNTPSLTARSMFFYIQSTGYFKCDPGYVTNRKDYNTMLLLYTLKGKGILKYRGQSFVLEQGQGFLIDCLDHQRYETYGDGDWDFKWLHFNGCESRSYFERIYENRGPTFELKSDSKIPGHLDEIARMIKERDHRIDALGSCQIVDILTELLVEDYPNNKDGTGMPSFVEQAIKIIENKFRLNMNLDLLARQVGVSKYHLSRIFKRYTGYSPYEYILNYRLSQSKDLLKSTDLPIYEVASKVGFDSSSHFIKQFRIQEGVTPLKFREYWR